MAPTRVAIYPTSSNPPTLGHADIVTRAARHFEHVYWAAAVNPREGVPLYSGRTQGDDAGVCRSST